MEHVLLVIHVLLATALIGVVLIQRSDSDGFGLGSGSGANLMTGRAAANLMTRTTAIIATLFVISSLVLSVLAAHGGKSSIVEQIEAQEESAPVVPVAADVGEASEATPALKRATAKGAENTAARRHPATPDAKAAAPAVPTAE